MTFLWTFLMNGINCRHCEFFDDGYCRSKKMEEELHKRDYSLYNGRVVPIQGCYLIVRRLGLEIWRNYECKCEYYHHAIVLPKLTIEELEL